MMIENL